MLKKIEAYSSAKHKCKSIDSFKCRCYTNFANGIFILLEEARHQSAKAVNAILTATYWEMGRRIIEVEQNGEVRAKYGEKLLVQLSKDLTAKFGRGFSVDNLERMRLFYNVYPRSEHDKAAAHYALGNLVNKVMATEYRLSLPDPKQLEEEIEKTRQLLQKMSKSEKAKQSKKTRKKKK